MRKEGRPQEEAQAQAQAPPNRAHDGEDEPMTGQIWSTTNRALSPRTVLCAVIATLSCWLLAPVAAQAASPSWGITVAPVGSSGYFNPGANGHAVDGPGFLVTVTNTGNGPTVGTYK